MSNKKLIDSVVRSNLVSLYAFSKAHFDTAKDTKDYLEAAKLLDQTLMQAIEYRLETRVEQMLSNKIEGSLRGHDSALFRIGKHWYTVAKHPNSGEKE